VTSLNLADLYKQYKKEDEITAVDPGTYELEVMRANVRNENAILPVFRVAAGPKAGQTVMAGQMTLTDKSRSIFFRQLKGFGIDESFFQRPGVTMQDVANTLVGRTIQATLSKEKWNGEDRNKLPIGGIKLLRISQSPQASPAVGPSVQPQVAPAPQPAPAQAAPQPAPVQAEPQQMAPVAQPAPPEVQAPAPAPAPAQQEPAQPAPVQGAPIPSIPVPPAVGGSPF
jgi:hypothetical protein